jgi:hypothetical protein
MRRTAALLGALALLVSLCACGAQGSIREGLFYEASGLSPDAEIMEVDGRPVTAERYLYWLTAACDAIADSYAAQGLEPDWSAMMGDETLAEYAAEQARSTACLYAQVEAWAERYGCALTDEDRTAMDQEWAEAAEAAGGEEAYLQRLADMGISQDFARAMSEDYYLYAQLSQLAQTEGSELYPSEGELTAWVEGRDLMSVEALKLSTEDIDPDDQEALTARRTTADNLRTQLALHEDPGEAFSALGAQVDVEQIQRTFAVGESGLPAAVETAARALAEGELSQVVEASDGYWLVLRVPLDEAATAAAWFDDAIQTAADSAEVTETSALEKLDVEKFYEKMTALREEQSAAETAEETGGADSSEAASSQGDSSQEGDSSQAASSQDGAAASGQGEIINLPDQNQQAA